MSILTWEPKTNYAPLKATIDIGFPPFTAIFSVSEYKI